jgi:hypothetical protein
VQIWKSASVGNQRQIVSFEVDRNRLEWEFVIQIVAEGLIGGGSNGQINPELLGTRF